ncbi:hypothetical protein IE81DRAFT_350342 [Ceraceosorus guamensis]|uniref:Uncharacterized protein n=1 Tax=Ceraceosorus guamensis TaxID=1522189 RepID=A0A316VNZ6_9BASI|nr:hypothetical protein IE81DRAFT_350342 [Ceraceosorus guamensis]PWN39252.1 hypothetical protein IE81DRAFT_350342 [Ceraceosorus guamensis]
MSSKMLTRLKAAFVGIIADNDEQSIKEVLRPLLGNAVDTSPNITVNVVYARIFGIHCLDHQLAWAEAHEDLTRWASARAGVHSNGQSACRLRKYGQGARSQLVYVGLTTDTAMGRAHADCARACDPAQPQSYLKFLLQAKKVRAVDTQVINLFVLPKHLSSEELHTLEHMVIKTYGVMRLANTSPGSAATRRLEAGQRPDWMGADLLLLEEMDFASWDMPSGLHVLSPVSTDPALLLTLTRTQISIQVGAEMVTKSLMWLADLGLHHVTLRVESLQLASVEDLGEWLAEALRYRTAIHIVGGEDFANFRRFITAAGCTLCTHASFAHLGRTISAALPVGYATHPLNAVPDILFVCGLCTWPVSIVTSLSLLVPIGHLPTKMEHQEHKNLTLPFVLRCALDGPAGQNINGRLQFHFNDNGTSSLDASQDLNQSYKLGLIVDFQAAAQTTL